MAAERSQQGFTLIEIITVLVVLSIVAVIGTGFIVSSTNSYLTTQNRALLTNTGRQAVERMTRQLRGALPNSVRITNGGNCLQFFPVAGGGNYLGTLPVTGVVPLGSDHDQIPTAPHQVDFGTAVFVSVGAMSDDELYGASPVSRATLANRSSTLLTLDGPKTWARNSASRRFYLLDQPQAFCLVGEQLRFYPAQDATAGNVNTGGGYDLLANNAIAVGTTAFVLSAGSENRNINVSFNIGFTAGGERVDFAQEVLIRNVP
jgi:MSHA biogenesis protein MshO